MREGEDLLAGVDYGVACGRENEPTTIEEARFSSFNQAAREVQGATDRWPVPLRGGRPPWEWTIEELDRWTVRELGQGGRAELYVDPEGKVRARRGEHRSEPLVLSWLQGQFCRQRLRLLPPGAVALSPGVYAVASRSGFAVPKLGTLRTSCLSEAQYSAQMLSKASNVEGEHWAVPLLGEQPPWDWTTSRFDGWEATFKGEVGVVRVSEDDLLSLAQPPNGRMPLHKDEWRAALMNGTARLLRRELTIRLSEAPHLPREECRPSKYNPRQVTEQERATLREALASHRPDPVVVDGHTRLAVMHELEEAELRRTRTIEFRYRDGTPKQGEPVTKLSSPLARDLAEVCAGWLGVQPRAIRWIPTDADGKLTAIIPKGPPRDGWGLSEDLERLLGTTQDIIVPDPAELDPRGPFGSKVASHLDDLRREFYDQWFPPRAAQGRLDKAKPCADRPESAAADDGPSAPPDGPNARDTEDVRHDQAPPHVRVNLTSEQAPARIARAVTNELAQARGDRGHVVGCSLASAVGAANALKDGWNHMMERAAADELAKARGSEPRVKQRSERSVRRLIKEVEDVLEGAAADKRTAAVEAAYEDMRKRPPCAAGDYIAVEGVRPEVFRVRGLTIVAGFTKEGELQRSASMVVEADGADTVFYVNWNGEADDWVRPWAKATPRQIAQLSSVLAYRHGRSEPPRWARDGRGRLLPEAAGALGAACANWAELAGNFAMVGFAELTAEAAWKQAQELVAK